MYLTVNNACCVVYNKMVTGGQSLLLLGALFIRLFIRGLFNSILDSSFSIETTAINHISISGRCKRCLRSQQRSDRIEAHFAWCKIQNLSSQGYRMLGALSNDKNNFRKGAAVDITTRRVRWPEHVTRMGKLEIHTKYSYGNTEDEPH